MNLHFSRLRRSEAIGAVAAVLLVISVFLPWFTLDNGNGIIAETGGWLCGTDEESCTAFETFTVLRWLLLAAASAPLILAWIIVRGHKISWPPGEMTTVVGATAVILILFQWVLGKPTAANGQDLINASLDYGFFLALLAALTISGTGAWRATETGKAKKPPGGI